jgi:hypothetical protein
MFERTGIIGELLARMLVKFKDTVLEKKVKKGNFDIQDFMDDPKNVTLSNMFECF